MADDEYKKAEEDSLPDSEKKGHHVGKFCETSTIHGLAAISNSSTKPLKFLWTVSFISACGLCIWQVSELIMKLTKNGITTVTTSSTSPEIDFPTLTICNSNPYSESKIRTEHGPWLESPVRNYSDIALNSLIAKKLGSMPVHKLRDLSGDISVFSMAMLNKSCLFAGRKCKDIAPVATAMLGTCIIFNRNSTITQIQAGPDFGFSATFNIMEEDYSRISFFQNAGPGLLVRVSTDFGMDYHEFKNSAILAAPGMLTQIKLKKKMKIRLPSPFKDNCTTEGSVNALHGVVFKNPPPYTIEWCKTACLLKWQMKVCGYVAPFFASMIAFRIDTKKSNISVSNTSGNDELEREHGCLAKSTASFFSTQTRACVCPLLCSETQYDFTISNLRWPSSAQAKTLLNDIKRSWPNDSSFKNWTEDSIYKNIAKIEVFFHDFQTLTVTQEQAYDWVKFLSDLGGQAGLWIGASVYSLFELVSFLISSFIKPIVSGKWRKRSVANENVK